MSVVYTADVFCDGEGCGEWTHGETGSLVPTKKQAREGAKHDKFVHVGNKDYCPACNAKRLRDLADRVLSRGVKDEGKNTL